MWVNLIVLLTLLSISNLAVTVYLHRVLTHRSIRLHPVLNHFFRISLWMFTPFPPKLWVAMHRYHHHTADSDRDPHSPLNTGLKQMITKGAFYYIQKSSGDDMHRIVDLYAKDFQDSPLEEFYLKHPYIGKIISLFFILLVCDIVYGLAIWAFIAIWMHVMEERLHVAMSHYWGYRNFKTKDNSRNIIPWAIFLFGEELHNNHHAKPNNWSFRAKWFEIDPAAIFIQILIWTRLARPTNNIKT